MAGLRAQLYPDNMWKDTCLVCFLILISYSFFTKNRIALDICVCVYRERLILKTLKVFLSLKHTIYKIDNVDNS